ncbi:MAG TPA: hypothetical protein VN816_05280 [Acidimicrobiales bacterium]|nr:hypothetical protein [Acidimicrobiales bacterium]
MSDETQRIEEQTRSLSGRALRRLPAVVGVAGLSVFVSGPALAGAAHVRPTITPTRATFPVPAKSTSLWTLRLWSHGTLEGSAAGTAGTLTVVVPHTADCTFQADVTQTPPEGQPSYYSGTRVTMSQCGGPPPAQTIAGHIYLCTPTGSPTTTEVAGGSLAASGPDTVASQANPLTPVAVASGSYAMTAGSPAGYLLVDCGGTATVGSGGLTASEPVTVPPGGAGVGLFYVSAPTVGDGGGSAPSPPVADVTSSADGPGVPSAAVPGATDAGHSPPPHAVAAAGSRLAFTGMDIGPPLLLGLLLLGAGTLMLACSGIRRRSRPVLRIEVRRTGRSAE